MDDPPSKRRTIVRSVVIGGLLAAAALCAGAIWWISSIDVFAPHTCENAGDDLVRAAAAGDTARVNELVDEDGRVDAPTGVQPLSCAAKNGHTEIVDVLLAHGAAADPADPQAPAPLFVAARDGRGEVVERLLAAGADPNRGTSTGPALLAAVAGRSPSDDTILFSDGRRSALGEPAQAPLDDPSRVAAVRALLRHGADPEAQRTNDPSPPDTASRPWPQPHPTPLFTAVATNQPHVVAALLEGGAQPSNPSYVAAPAVGEVLAGTPGTSALLRGTLPTPTRGLLSADSYRIPPLFAAAAEGRREIVQALLDAGADPNQEALGGFRPLHAAVLADDPEIVGALLAAGADPAGHGLPVSDPGTFAVEQGKARAAAALTGAGA